VNTVKKREYGREEKRAHTVENDVYQLRERVSEEKRKNTRKGKTIKRGERNGEKQEYQKKTPELIKEVGFCRLPCGGLERLGGGNRVDTLCVCQHITLLCSGVVKERGTVVIDLELGEDYEIEERLVVRGVRVKGREVKSAGGSTERDFKRGNRTGWKELS